MLWSAIIPGYIFYRLYLNRNDLNKISVRYIYGFFYNEYKFTRYYWEFVKIYLKLLLIIIINYFAYESI